MTDIILDLDKSEFDEFDLKETDLWQQDAARQLRKHLTTLGRAAKKIKDCEHPLEGGTTRHVHDAILISGGRGTGKSIFLYNSKTLWEEQKDKDKDKPNLYFLDPIDPTLLQDNDSFSNVIIANIYNSVHEKIKGKPQKESQKFYDRLRKLAESIEEVDKQQLGGLDKLMHYSSGVRVQDNFYRFVKEAITLLCCDALVLPIDDVDMALGKAYAVLEEIRCRLCCPFIIPLVSGDPDLYEHLVKNNFSKSIVNNKTNDTKVIKIINNQETKFTNDIPNKEFEESNNNLDREKILLTDLPKAYLTKVLPHHYRITLQSIDAITSTLIIKWNNNNSIPYARKNAVINYQDRLLSFFFGPKHDDEKGRDYPWPKSSRELGQMVRLLRPDALKYPVENDVDMKNMFEDFKTWSSACQHGACYTLALSALEFKRPCRASQLTAFNLHKQANLNLPWAKYDFIGDQKKIVDSYQIANPNKYNSNRNPVATANNVLIEKSLRSNVLRSMPPIELHLDKMSITLAKVKEEKNRILLAIYTYKSYYGTQGNKQLKIYFSKAIDILFTSILNASKEDDANKHLYKEILEQAPFYSVYNLSPTKQVEEEASDDPDDESADTIFDTENEDLILKITEWEKKYADIINTTFTNHSQTISLLSAVFNKTLTQIGYLRKSFKMILASRDDELIDLALRFKYITLNSFGFFLKENGIRVASNIGIETQKSTLKDVTNFAKFSNTYRENIGWIEKDDSTESKFIDAITKHPVFVQLGDTNLTQNTLTPLALPTLMGHNDGKKKQLNRIRRRIAKKIKERFNHYFENTKYNTPDKLTILVFEGGVFSDPNILIKANNLFSSLKFMSKRIAFLSDRHPLKKLYTSLSEKLEETV